MTYKSGEGHWLVQPAEEGSEWHAPHSEGRYITGVKSLRKGQHDVDVSVCSVLKSSRIAFRRTPALIWRK